MFSALFAYVTALTLNPSASRQGRDFKNVFVVQLDEKLSVGITCLGDFETGHQQVCIWSDRPDEYICIEPIIHDNTLFGTDQGYFVGNEAKCFHVSYACTML